MKYKCVPAPRELVIDRNGSYEGAVRSFADLINRETKGGWNFHSMENIAVSQEPGCLAALFGQGNTTTYFNMLVFSKEEKLSSVSPGNELEVDKDAINNENIAAANEYDMVTIKSTPLKYGSNLGTGTIKTLDNGTRVKFVSEINPQWYCVETSEGEKGFCQSSDLQKI
jgi:hypothetical protein